MKGDVTLTFSPLSFWGIKKNITKKFKVTFTDVLQLVMGITMSILFLEIRFVLN